MIEGNINDADSLHRGETAIILQCGIVVMRLRRVKLTQIMNIVSTQITSIMSTVSTTKCDGMTTRNKYAGMTMLNKIVDMIM